MNKIIFIHCDLPEYRVPLFFKMCDSKQDYHFIIYNYSEKRKTKDIILSSKYKENFSFIENKKSYGFIKKMLSFIRKVKKIYKKIKPKYIFLDSPIYLETIFIFFYFFRIKKIIWDEEFLWKKTFKRNLVMSITNYINRKSYAVLVPTEGHKIYQKAKWVNEKKIVLFPNVTNIDTQNIDKR